MAAGKLLAVTPDLRVIGFRTHTASGEAEPEPVVAVEAN
jgi:hypothetical protein